MGLPFHGELHVDIRSGPTPGIPVVATLPDGPHARIYRSNHRAGARSGQGRHQPGGAEDHHRTIVSV